MSRLILVSNRLPVTLAYGPKGLRVERSVGGVATGLRLQHEQSGGLWIGWPGPIEADPATRGELESRLAELGIVPVHLTEREVRRYYEGYANGVLWPLFHYLTGLVPVRARGWEDYVAANRHFARTVIEQYRPGDLIWVHDYQLMLVPGMIRRELPDARIGYFLHIPFPSSELFATLANREDLLEGVCGADLIGFHTASYRRHFESTLERLLGLAAENEAVQYEGRHVRLGVFAMGVDARALSDRADQPDVAARAASLRADSPGKLLVGIDRLDYTKGIPRRLLAFETLLARRPEWHGRVRLLQVAVPSRTGLRSYRRFREEVDALVGHINGTFGTPHWVPVHYLYRSVPEAQLLAFYRAADVLLVTPVRDGMNLVAKEFVATRTDDDGVLVLSEFAGAAAELHEALLVNPYDLNATADAYHRALTMEPDERRERMRELRERVCDRDVQEWVASFLTALKQTEPIHLAMPNALSNWQQLSTELEGRRPVLFLDYDGTLTPIVSRPEDARLSPDMKATLQRLAEVMPVVLISGRARTDLQKRTGLHGVVLAGSHGFDIAGPNVKAMEVGAAHKETLREAAQELHKLAMHVPGVAVEDKTLSVAVHYRRVDKSDVQRVLSAVDEVLGRLPALERHYGKKVIELRPAVDWDKGRAVSWLLGHIDLDGAEPAAIFLGDDRTDEDAFAAVAENGIGILIASAPRPTNARYSLRNVQEVKAFLDRLADRFVAARRTA